MRNDIDLTLIKKHEACSSKIQGKNVILTQEDIACNITVYPYQCPANKWTIGWGCVVQNKQGEYEEHYKNGISVKECEELLLKRVSEFVLQIDELSLNLNTNEFNGVLSLVFNIGFGAFNKSGLLQEIKKHKLENANNKEIIKTKWLSYNKARKSRNEPLVVFNGLTKRRQEEVDLFLSNQDISFEHIQEENIFSEQSNSIFKNYIDIIKEYLSCFRDFFI